MKYLILFTFSLLVFISNPSYAESPLVVKPVENPNRVLGIKIVNAIKYHETKGNCSLKGASGERGCFQFLPSTFKSYQKIYLATTTLPLTPENEQRIMEMKVIDLLSKGKTVYDIALEHNSGHFGKCSAGVNKWGVSYDSCKYVRTIIALVK